MAIRFLTDSTADILPQEAAQRDIDRAMKERGR